MANTLSSKAKIKINYSYESQQSSSSGSSSSGDITEEQACDEDIVHLPCLIKCSTIVTETPQTSFEGFSDSPYGNVNKMLFGSQYDKRRDTTEVLKDVRNQNAATGKLIFPKCYDAIVSENSCNAVDIPIPRKVIQKIGNEAGSCAQRDLTFNGIIKSIKKIETKISATAPLRESFNSKKYRNERSPDIFADSDDDDDDDDDVENGTEAADVSNNDSNTLATNVSRTLTEGSNQGCSDTDKLLLQNSRNNSMRSGCGDDDLTACEMSQSSSTSFQQNKNNNYRENCRRQNELLKRIRRSLNGVRPPPCVTMPQIDVCATVVKLKTEILNFLPTNVQNNDEKQSGENSLFEPTHTLDEVKAIGWRDVLGVRQHGISYNLNKASEHNEYLSLSVIERFVGEETTTSYVRSPSSAKKRSARLKHLMQSPGNRLSHLARRRAIFSSANLATTSQKLNNSIGPQIAIDDKKGRNKRKVTPKRMTPGSRKKSCKLHSSSEKKRRLFRCDLIKSVPTRETSKRALFQSPAKGSQQQQVQSAKPLIKPEIANRVEKSKRALFLTDAEKISRSSFGNVHLENMMKRKRNADDDDEAAELASQSSKLFRSDNWNNSLTPRALKIKSQSFCIGAGSSTNTAYTANAVSAKATMATATTTGMATMLNKSDMDCNSSSKTISGGSGGTGKLQRAYSEMAAPHNSLTENQRKKLLWAVSQALQEKKITAKHENFKQYASVLARAVKRIFQEFHLKNSTSNSVTMLRLTTKYVYSVLCGKSADDIYAQEKSLIEQAKRLSNSRLSGYIGAAEYAHMKQTEQQQQTEMNKSRHAGSLQNIFSCSENSMDASSYSFSQLSKTSTVMNDSTTAFSLSQTSLSEMTLTKSATKPIQPNPTQQNSSSKNNLGVLALRENVDCDQRRSAQKNFTGKDQRNVSPYANGNGNSNNGGSGLKVQANTVGNSLKAKRQITFDS